MAKHRMSCQDPWFSLIRAGKKLVEGRRNSPGWQKLKVGDDLELFCNKEAFTVKICRIDRFPTLEAYLEGVGLENALPGVASMEEAKKIYLHWSTEAQIKRWGFLGIWIEFCKAPI
jgi:ASC-1-like (ASCH) protein